jgi:hypothetical protein
MMRYSTPNTAKPWPHSHAETFSGPWRFMPRQPPPDTHTIAGMRPEGASGMYTSSISERSPTVLKTMSLTRFTPGGTPCQS